MPINETRAVSVTLDASTPIAPRFIPLVDLVAGNILSALHVALRGRDCDVHGSNLKGVSPAGMVTYPDVFVRCGPLADTGTPTPLEVAVMLCKPATVLGDPADAVLQVGEVFNVVAGKPFVLLGNVPPLDQGGVLGLHVPVQTLTTGAKVEGVLSIVR